MTHLVYTLFCPSSFNRQKPIDFLSDSLSIFALLRQLNICSITHLNRFCATRLMDVVILVLFSCTTGKLRRKSTSGYTDSSNKPSAASSNYTGLNNSNTGIVNSREGRDNGLLFILVPKVL